MDLELPLVGEAAIELMTSMFDSEDIGFTSLPGLLYRFQLGKTTENDLVYLVTPGVIDAFVYHDRFVIEDVWEPDEIEELEMIRILERSGIVRTVKRGTLLDRRNILARCDKIATEIWNDSRYCCVEVLVDPCVYSEYLKRRGLLRNVDPTLVNTLKKKSCLSDEDHISFLKQIDVRLLYDSIAHNNPVSVVHLEQYVNSLLYKCPVVYFSPGHIFLCPDASIMLAGNEVINSKLVEVTKHVLERISNVRTDLSQKLQQSHLFRLEDNDAEIPLTLALALDRIKEKRVSPSLLWDSLRELHKDNATIRFRGFLKKFEAAVRSQDREKLLKSEKDLEFAAEELKQEYSKCKPFETRHFTKIPSLAVSLVLQRYDEVLLTLSEKTIEHLPTIAEKLGLYSHINYMTRLGRIGIQSRSIKNTLAKRFGDIGDKMAKRYIYLTHHTERTKEVLDYARETRQKPAQHYHKPRASETRRRRYRKPQQLR